MTSAERIAAAVEFVRSRQGNYERASKQFGMTMDVIRKACAAENVSDYRFVRPAGQRDRHGLGAPYVSVTGRAKRGRFF